MSDSYRLRFTYGVIALIFGIIAMFGSGCFLVLSILINEQFALLLGICFYIGVICFTVSSIHFIESGQYLHNDEDEEEDDDDDEN